MRRHGLALRRFGHGNEWDYFGVKYGNLSAHALKERRRID